MVRTRIQPILYFLMPAHKAACNTMPKAVLKSGSEDIVRSLLMLQVLLTQESEDEGVFCGSSSGSEPTYSSAIISSAWGLSLFEMTFIMTLLELLMRLMIL